MIKYIIFGVSLLVFTVIIIILSSKSSEYVEKLSESRVDLDPTKKLITLHVLFRHGARTPVATYPKDPYINETYYPIGFGQLTKPGRTQMYEIGKWLRGRYGEFLGNVYNYEEIFVQSTNLYRTKMSTAAVLAGLYPPRNTLMDWNEELNWQPIPIYSTELEQDHLLWILSSCHRYNEAWAEVLHSIDTQPNYNESQQLLKELKELTGFTFKSPLEILLLFQMLQSQEQFGLKLPDWTKDYYPNRLKPFCEMYYMYSSWTEEMKRLKGGPFVAQLIRDWTSKINNTIEPTKRKLFIYGAHDLSLVPIMSALNVWQKQMPAYGMMAIFELLQDRFTGEYGVKLYQKIPNKHIQPLTVPGCTYFCPIDRFVYLMGNVIPTKFELECIPKNPNFKPPTLPKTL